MNKILIVLILACACAFAQADTTITYQGQLRSSGSPFTGTPDMSFQLYDGMGVPVGTPVNLDDVPVTDGLFSVELDFGEVFDGSSLFLEISVDGTVLEPQQKITAVPIANYAMTPVGPEGPQGPQGPQGSQGPQGPQGPPGESPFELIDDHAVFLQGNVGIGTSNPDVPLEVIGSVKFGSSSNQASGEDSFVSGGTLLRGAMSNQASGNWSFVGGGVANTASGESSFVGGGESNTASGDKSFVGGGESNTASGDKSFVGGGTQNHASGVDSFAAGSGAKAIHDGTFVWASIGADFESSGDNQFLIGADGGVGINTDSPIATLDVAGDARFGGAIGIDFSDPADMPPNGGVDLPTIYTLFEDGTSQGLSDIEGFYFGAESSADPILSVTSVRSLGVARNYLRLLRPAEGSLSGAAAELIVEGNATVEFNLVVDNFLRVGQFGSSGSIDVCRSAGGVLADCSSSERYKSDIRSLDHAGDLVASLRPVSYVWKASGEPDIGLVAEEVAMVLPEIVTRNEDGSVEGIKYSRIAPLLVAAFQEHQASSEGRITQLVSRNEELASVNDQLRAQVQVLEAELQALSARVDENQSLVEHDRQFEDRLAVVEALLLDRQHMTTEVVAH